jgi:hypothetical protein
MTTPLPRGGAGVSARSVTPSIDLATLVDLLTKSLEGDEVSPAPLVRLDGSKLSVNLYEPLLRLVASEDFQKAFAPGQESGFLRDTTAPAKGTAARVGGRLLHSSEAKTAKAIDKLREVVAKQVAEQLGEDGAAALTLGSMQEALKAWADSIQEPAPKWPATAALQPVAFAPTSRRADDRAQDVGRVMTAIETVDGADSLENLIEGIAVHMRKKGLGDQVEEVAEALRHQRTLPGSLMREFIDFLDDEALSRVRLQVTMRLMVAIAAQSSSPALKAYVANVLRCFELFTSAEAEPLLLDVAARFGQANNTELGEHLRKALFFNCLSVWAQWSVQLFETRADPSHGLGTVREVSYRFRVNGMNPTESKTAFDARMDKLSDRLLTPPENDRPVRRDVAELVFLYLVVPDNKASEPRADLLADAKKLAEALKTKAEPTLRVMLERLRQRSSVMDAIADELIEVLKSKSNKVVALAGSTTDNFTVSINRGIIDWEAVSSMTTNTEVLKRSERGDNSIEWFSYLMVSEKPVVSGSIASYKVKTELKERALALSGPAASVRFERRMDTPVLPIRLVPYHCPKGEQEWRAHLPNPEHFATNAGVEVHVNLRVLALRKPKDEKERAQKEQMRAASVAAFTVLAYVVLWEIQALVRRVQPDASLALLRLQHTGRQSDTEQDADDPNTAVYAATQALEKALAREGLAKLQGVTTFNEGRMDDLKWRRRGALAALASGQPLRFGFEGTLDKVALITYVTRPCDEHPAYGDADGYLFVSRTYVAERSGNEGVLKMQSMRSRFVGSRNDFKNPQLVLEEVARLHAQGFKHVMLLSHHFGNRHIGRAAERHAPHGSLEFLDAAIAKFPDINLYTLRRDVFPATRMRKRAGNESAFEVVNFGDHQEMYDQVSDTVRRSVVPIYTFATLAIVGDEGERPQSGFCTYFFDGEQRISNLNAREQTRQNILGVGAEAAETRRSLVSVLRAIHFFEAEKAPQKGQPVIPVLDPYGWVNPIKRSAVGEIVVMSRRRAGNVLLCLPALLAHVTKVLHKEHS